MHSKSETIGKLDLGILKEKSCLSMQYKSQVKRRNLNGNCLVYALMMIVCEEGYMDAIRVHKFTACSLSTGIFLLFATRVIYGNN